MIPKQLFIVIAISVAALCGCSSADPSQGEEKGMGKLTFTSTITPFKGEAGTRTNVEGTAFKTGDRMKLKIICPFSDHVEYGETTYSGSFDALWLMKWSGSNWQAITAKDSVDVLGLYAYTDAPNLYNEYEAQQTPYVYTASTWNDNVIFQAPVNGALSVVSQYSYIFHADQSREKDYLSSDLLWAQQYMQTGSYNVHLSFQHVMADLLITIDSSMPVTDSTVLTLEGMPDIDQAEVVVGDNYASRSKINSPYGYMQKCACSYDNNGKVLGIAVIDDANQKAAITPMTGNPGSSSATATVPNTGVYAAYHKAGTRQFRLIVPPCVLDANPVFWLRNGQQRYKAECTQKTFEQGLLYPITLKLD
ncbi:MAG: fimbrillin family protein [Prevotella sp.]